LESSVDELQAISKCVTKFTITDLYLMMGRELEPIDSVPSGNIAAIGGLKQLILKSATISTTPFCPSFISTNLQTTPIVRVAVEPKNPAKLKDLLKGLRLLNQADPCVEIMLLENGEHILCAAGEVHLQRCIDDLIKQFAKCEVNVSPPIIPFKETIVKQIGKPTADGSANDQQPNAKTNQQREKGGNKFDEDLDSAATVSNSSSAVTNNQNFVLGADGRIEMSSPDKRLRVWMKARPLPLEFVRFLDENAQLAKLLNRVNQNKLEANSSDYVSVLAEFKENLKKSFAECKSEDEYYTHKDWEDLVERIISFGPNRHGPNVLVNSLGSLDAYALNSVWAVLDSLSEAKAKQQAAQQQGVSLREFENNIVFGFNLATAKGPLCEEPVQGVAFFLENFQLMDGREDSLINELNEKLNITCESQEDDSKRFDIS
jgi:ribosome assembly protein 1